MMSKVFVTGHTGKIGRYLTKELDNRKIEWVGYSRSTGDFIEDKKNLWEKMQGCDCIVHLAGLVSFRYTDYSRLFESIYKNTERIIEIAKETGIRRMIYIGSNIVNEELNAWYSVCKTSTINLVKKEFLGIYTIINPATVGITRFTKDLKKKTIYCPPGTTNIIKYSLVADAIVVSIYGSLSNSTINLTGTPYRYQDIYQGLINYYNLNAKLFLLPKWSKGICKIISSKLNDPMISPEIVEKAFREKKYYPLLESELKELIDEDRRIQ